jgi:hypothetical protein
MPEGAERVLCKSSRQRLAEKILLPAALLPIGPLTRTAIGDRYSAFYGIAVTSVMLLLLHWISCRLAPRLGGAWMTPSDRLRLYAAELIARPRWLTALSTATMFATILFAFLLLVSPLDQLGDSLGGTAIILIGVVSACAALQMLKARTALRETTVADGDAPAGYLRHEVLRTLPWTYAAILLATTVGIVIAFLLPPSQRSFIFFATAVIIPFILRVLLIRRLMPSRLYAVTPTIGDRMMLTPLNWGVPMAIIFSGFTILELWNEPILAAGIIACIWIVIGIGSLALGALSHWLVRMTEQRGQSA